MSDVKEPKFLIEGKEISMPFGVGSNEDEENKYVKKISKEIGNSPKRDVIFKMLEDQILKKREEWFNRQLKEKIYKDEMYKRGLPPVDVIAMFSKMGKNVS